MGYTTYTAKQPKGFLSKTYEVVVTKDHVRFHSENFREGGEYKRISLDNQDEILNEMACIYKITWDDNLFENLNLSRKLKFSKEEIIKCAYKKIKKEIERKEELKEES